MLASPASRCMGSRKAAASIRMACAPSAKARHIASRRLAVEVRASSAPSQVDRRAAIAMGAAAALSISGLSVSSRCVIRQPMLFSFPRLAQINTSCCANRPHAGAA
jgi:hypothetical protein